MHSSRASTDKSLLAANTNVRQIVDRLEKLVTGAAHKAGWGDADIEGMVYQTPRRTSPRSPGASYPIRP